MRGRPDELVEVIELLVSEIVTNAISHASSPCRLTIEFLRGGEVHVEVHDQHADFHAFGGNPDDEQLSGRGLLIVDALASQWGCEPTDGHGKKVWFHVTTPLKAVATP